jgi:tRNA(Ile)-lysidine synthase
MTDPLSDPAAVFTAESWPADVGVVVAVSGGRDSVAALRLAAEAARRLGRRVHAVHVDHGLRPESGRDADAAAEAARRLGVPFTLRRAEVPRGRGSPEGPARDARYASLAEAARACDAARILVAHSREDHWETILLALRRGGGLGALGGLRLLRPLPCGAALWRPFLAVPRAVLRAAARDLPTVEDPTNADASLRRNAARLRLLPSLEAAAPDFPATLTALAEAARAIDERAAAVAAAFRRAAYSEPGLVSFSRHGLAATARAARLRFWLDLFRDEPAFGGPPSAGQLRELEVALTRTGARCEPRRGVVFTTRDAEALLFVPKPGPTATVAAPSLGSEARVEAGGGRYVRIRRRPEAEAAAFAPPAGDAPREMLLFAPPSTSFSVKPAEPGAHFRLETGAGRGRVRDVLRENAVAPEWRTRVPLVYAGDALRWLPGLRRVGAPRAPDDVAFELTLCGAAPWIDATAPPAPTD